MNKKRIPASLRQAVWLKYNGANFYGKCAVKWCKNEISPFTFEAGHNHPESKGGATNLDNLIPICTTCNRSMGNRFSIDEYSKSFDSATTHVRAGFLTRLLRCFKK